MYAHILVGLDGSEVAEQILPDVEALGEKFHCTVTLLRAIVPLEQAVAAELGVESLFVDQDGSSKMSSANRRISGAPCRRHAARWDHG